MRWDRDHDSPDVIDKRGEGGGPQIGGGLFYLLPLLMRSKFGWLIILVGGAYYLISGRLGGGGTQRVHDAPVAQGKGTEQPMVAFVSFVLDDTQKTWSDLFRERGKTYQHAKMVLFTDSTQTGCGYGESATGPFYCPADSRVYIDLGFYRELSDKLGAKGDFAQAYVIAHEIGHHVQNLLGTSDRVHQARGADQKGATGLSVRLELQADCYAGIWGHSTEKRNLLERGDLDEAITAAAAIGDDRLQRMSRGAVNPEKWTHGSSEQRSRWFRRGYETGKLESCDTFSPASP